MGNHNYPITKRISPRVLSALVLEQTTEHGSHWDRLDDIEAAGIWNRSADTCIDHEAVVPSGRVVCDVQRLIHLAAARSFSP